ncbi:RNA-directed DNA polymerase, eukaryota, reverse transcriptase zinc-binding domain protein, partial [Tanacetum coccineum]
MTYTSKQDEIKLLISKNRLSMLAIIETMLIKKVFKPDIIDAVLLAAYQVMHFKVKLIQDKRCFLVSFIYGENEPRDRLKLWDNLSDHKDLVNNRPWTLLGDFNVIMNAYEHSKGVADIYKGIHEFRNCMENLDMEELAMNGLFLTWVQKMKDPEKGILKKLDRVMGNSSFFELFGHVMQLFCPMLPLITAVPFLLWLTLLRKKRRAFRFMNYLADKKELKGMKRHLRELNKKNGNVHDKVKRLRDDLKKVQIELDKDLDVLQKL